MQTNIKQRPEVSDSKNTLAYYEMREKKFYFTGPRYLIKMNVFFCCMIRFLPYQQILN